MAFGRKKKADLSPTTAGDLEGRASKPDSDRTLTDNYDNAAAPTPWQLKRATKTRKTWTIISAFLLFCSVIFTIMVEIGNTSNKPGLTNLYFIRLNLTNVFPASIPNATVLNSIARSLGLDDYYQVGLWNYCGGYNNGGIQTCTKPQTLYWFNPVAIIQSQLFAGASSQFITLLLYRIPQCLTARQSPSPPSSSTSSASSASSRTSCSASSSPRPASPPS